MIIKKNNCKEEFCIIGGGLVGTLLSIYLAERGIRSEIFEKRPDIRMTDLGEGRSIVMSLSHRGWHALNAVGLKRKIEKISVPKFARMVHHSDGTINTQQYGRKNHALYSVNRRTINSILLNRTEETGLVKIYFDSECSELDLENRKVVFINPKTNRKYLKNYDKIIGADGIFSKVRGAITSAYGSNNGLTMHDYVYKEFTIPPGKDGRYILHENHIHIWPRESCLLVGMPNYNKTFTCTLFYSDKEFQAENIYYGNNLQNFLKSSFPDVVSIIPDFACQFLEKKTSSMFSVKSPAWVYRDNAAIIGDAAHAIVPFYGMGMNIGFEDCTVFNSLIDDFNYDWNKIFSEFFNSRKPETDAIDDLSLENLQHLKHSVNKDFQTRWELERKIWKMYPNYWMPTYVMVAFSSMPFRRIKEISEEQNKVLNQLLINKKIRENLNQKRFFYILAKYMSSYIINIRKIQRYIPKAGKIRNNIFFRFLSFRSGFLNIFI